MIVNDFFTDTWTRGDGIFTSDIVKMSREFGKITGESDWAAPYYMGYIPWSKFPRHFTPFTVATNSNTRTVTFHNLCINKNIPWFYASWGGNYQNNTRMMEILKPDTPGSVSTLWNNVRVHDGSYIQGNYGHGLINRLQIIKLTQGGQYRFGYYCFKVNLAGQVSDIFYKDNNVLNFTQLKDFFEGGSALTLEIQGGSTVDVHASDITDKGTLIYHSSDYKIVFLTSGFLLPANMMEAGEYNTFNLSVGFRLPVPNETGGNAFTSYYIPNGLCATTNEPHINLNENYQLSDYIRQSCVQIYDTNYFFGGLHGELSFDDFPPFPGTSSQPANYKWNDEKELLLEARFDGTYKNVNIRWSAPWRACYDFILMLNKHAENSNRKPPYSDTYSTEYPVSMFTSTDTPTGESVGEPYNRVEPKLREWQKAGKSISDDDFDVDNMPEDEPGGGDDDPGTDPDDDDEKDDAPDKQDWGDPMNPNNGFDIPYGFANYKAFNNAGIINFAERLWDAPDDFWEALTIANKNNANWLDYFISLRAYPYWINSTGEEANIYVGAGGKFYLGDEGTNLYASNPQHITFFVLNFSIDKYYNNFLDFAPYTKAYVYLPFSGTWEVNPKYLYHTSLQILLKLDITDGSGVWQLIRSGADTAGSGYIILEKQCKIGVEIPLSGLNATTMSSNIVNATLGAYQRTGNAMGKIAGTIATGTAGAALGGPVGAVVGMAAGAAMTGLENSVDMANANREHISVNGGMSGLAAANCNVIPSITLVRPIAQNPDSFPHTIGYLVNKAATLSSLNGFTTCRNVDVTNVGQATDKEKAQLKKILEGGFYA